MNRVSNFWESEFYEFQNPKSYKLLKIYHISPSEKIMTVFGEGEISRFCVLNLKNEFRYCKHKRHCIFTERKNWKKKFEKKPKSFSFFFWNMNVVGTVKSDSYGVTKNVFFWLEKIQEILFIQNLYFHQMHGRHQEKI